MLQQLANWQSTPLVTKSLIVCTFVIFTLSSLIEQYLTFTPASLERVELWRLFTSVLFQGGLITYLISMLCLQDIASAEKRIGSVNFLFEVFIKNAIGMLLMYLFYKGEYFLFGIEKMDLGHFGLWNIAIYFITWRALKQPDQDMQILFLPLMVKAKFYLIGLIVFLNLIPATQLSILVFTQVAVFEYIIFGHPVLRLVKAWAELIETRVKWSSRQDFILVDHAQEMIFQGTQKIDFKMETFQRQIDLSPGRSKSNTEDDSMQLK